MLFLLVFLLKKKKNIYIYIYFENCACSAILKLGFCVVWMKALLGTDFGGVFVFVGTLD